MKFVLNTLVRGENIHCDGEVLVGKFQRYQLLDESDSNSLVGIILTDGTLNEVYANSMRQVDMSYLSGGLDEVIEYLDQSRKGIHPAMQKNIYEEHIWILRRIKSRLDAIMSTQPTESELEAVARASRVKWEGDRDFETSREFSKLYEKLKLCCHEI